jgi:hypothetical protein
MAYTLHPLKESQIQVLASLYQKTVLTGDALQAALLVFFSTATDAGIVTADFKFLVWCLK